MYDNSEDAMNANEAISHERAAAELKRHGCWITDYPQAGFIAVTNGLDPIEVIPCRTKAILEWLGY